MIELLVVLVFTMGMGVCVYGMRNEKQLKLRELQVRELEASERLLLKESND